MQYTRVSARTRPPTRDPRVYADLDELVRLQFQAQGFSFLPRQPVHSLLNGRHASRLRGRGLNFEELRAYVPGDDIRNVDWKATARAGSPQLRVYTEERDRPVWLLVDQRQSMFFGSRERMKAVVAAEAAALAAWRVLGAGDRVGAVVFNDHEIREFPPRGGRNHVIRILSAVVELNHTLAADARQPARAEQYNAALERVVRHLRHDGLLCSFSDGLGVDEDTRRLVTRICAHNDVLAVFVYDPLERELAASGRLVFADARGQVAVDGAARGLREGFRTAFEERLAWMAQLARQHTVPLLPVHTGEPVAGQVRRLLGYRGPQQRG